MKRFKSRRTLTVSAVSAVRICRLGGYTWAMRIVAILICLFFTATVIAQQPALTNTAGLRLAVDDQNDMAALRIHLPSEADSDSGIFVLFPEHVTRPAWHRIGNSLRYQAELPQGIVMVARATLQNDGVRYRYQFTNHSNVDYDMMQAVTDPRMVRMAMHLTGINTKFPCHH